VPSVLVLTGLLCLLVLAIVVAVRVPPARIVLIPFAVMLATLLFAACCLALMLVNTHI
jgi:hypothetical protein